MNSPNLVFCDSYEALNKLYNSGLPKKTKIITKSPKILSMNNSNILNLEELTNTAYRETFHKKSKGYTYDIFKILKKHKKYAEYSILLSYRFSTFYNKIYFSTFFQDNYFKGEFWVVKPICDDNNVNSAISSDIYSILEEHSLCKKKIVSVNITKERSLRGDSNVSIFSRLRVVGYKGIFWNFLNFISLLYKKNKIKISIISSNELVRDISYYLLWKKNLNLNYDKNFLKFNVVNNKNITQNIIIKDLENIINKVFHKALADVSLENIRKLLNIQWQKEIIKTVNTYNTYKNSIKDRLNNKKTDLILFGYLDMIKGLALYNISKSKNIPLISCQHGITREIIFDPNLRSIFYETSFSDYFFCYNEVAKEVTQNSIYLNNNNIYKVGLPSDYKNFIVKNKNSKEICYISTFLLSGGIPNLIAPEPDIKLINWEFELINNIFKKIDKIINYKPYPAIRYAEDDINIKEVKESANLKLVGTHIDFRYIISNYGLLITSGATSTLGWCVQSNIPLVFINRKGSFSVKTSVLRDFKRAFFIFDENDHNWQEALKLFLEKKHSYIIKLWNIKSESRKLIVNKYFGDVRINAGKSGANFINNLIKRKKYE